MIGFVVPVAPMVWADEEEVVGEETPKKPLAFIDIGNSKEGSYPGGSTPVEGKWWVDANASILKIETEPLVEGWFEFGPEIREKGATIQAAGMAPGEGKIRSRMGVGLFGPNGFQLRLVFARNEIELVRRGRVLGVVSFDLEPKESYRMELSILEDEGNWMITGRVWADETDRPLSFIISYKAFKAELLFPLAGRAVLIATPFSGEPVGFLEASVFDGEIVMKDDEDDSESGAPAAIE